MENTKLCKDCPYQKECELQEAIEAFQTMDAITEFFDTLIKKLSPNMEKDLLEPRLDKKPDKILLFIRRYI